MVGMALLMGIVTVLVGFFASRVGAGIGMNAARESVQTGRWIFQCGDGSFFHSFPDYEKHE